MSTWHSVHLGVWLLGFCLFGSLATRHSAHVGLCILLILSTLGSAHLWFFLLGSQSIWVVVFLEIVYLGVLLHDILPKWDCVKYLSCQLCILLAFGLFYLGFYLPWCLVTWNLSSWEFGNMTFCPRWCVSTNGSVNSGFSSRLVLLTWDYVHEGIFLLEIMYSWHSVYIGVWLLGFCSLGSMPIWQSVHKVLYPRYGLSNVVGLTCSSLLLWICLNWCLSSWIWSTLESGHMIFSLSRIVSTICYVNYGFCSRLALSTWDAVQLGVCLLGFCPLASLATWHSAHIGLFPLLVLSTLLSAHVWFCLLGSLSNWVFVYLNSVHLGSLATWHSAQVVLCPLLILSTLGSAHFWLCPLGSQSNWVVVYLKSVYLESLSTWYSAHVGLCPILILTTMCSAHGWFSLLGSQFPWVVVFLNSIYLGSLATWHSAHVGLCQLVVRWTLDSIYVWFYLL